MMLLFLEKGKKHKKEIIITNRKRKNRSNKLSNSKYGKQNKRYQNDKNNDIDDDTRFNSEEYHKKQHNL